MGPGFRRDDAWRLSIREACFSVGVDSSAIFSRRHKIAPPPHELHDSIEHPAFVRAQSGRFCANASLPGCSS